MKAFDLLTELLPHQRQAVEKLIGIRVGALYMEMGTGKTRTALEFIRRRLLSGRIDHALWLCPCSVRESLKQDIRKHTDNGLASIAVYGIESLSSSITLFDKLARFASAGTTMIVIDESNLIKNHKAIRTERITQLASLCRYRMILNGTPISRNEADLFAQWYVLDWRILGYRSFYSFAANHIEYDHDRPGRIRRTLNTSYLVEKIAPYSFQVSKDECFTLPRKDYSTAYCSMSDAQETHYSEVVGTLIDQIDEQNPSTIYRMFAAAQAIISGLHVDLDGDHMKTKQIFTDPEENPRIQCFLDAVPPEGKVLIFAKYTHEIHAIHTALERTYGEGRVVDFYGGIPAKQRQKNLETFRGPARFMAANKVCAGYGLNLQFCHHVIYYSNDWDWATRAQSEDRVHRLGQESNVSITDICCRRSLDSRILSCLSRKERLEECIKQELNRSNGTKEAKGKFRAWLRGELDEKGGEKNGKAVH